MTITIKKKGIDNCSYDKGSYKNNKSTILRDIVVTRGLKALVSGSAR
jgi:hypothetical protein